MLVVACAKLNTSTNQTLDKQNKTFQTISSPLTEMFTKISHAVS